MIFIHLNIHFTFITVTIGNDLSSLSFLYPGVITSIVLVGSPAILGYVSLLITVEADNFSFLSSVIAALSLGLSSVFLGAVSLHVCYTCNKSPSS